MAFQKALNSGELAEGQGRAVQVGAQRLALFRSGGVLYAVDEKCSHAWAALADGVLVEPGVVECPLHGALFDLRTGQAKTLPARQPIRTYAVRENDGVIEVDLG